MDESIHQSTAVPVYQEYMNPVLEVLRAHAVSLPTDDIDRAVIESMGLSPEVCAIPHKADKPDRSAVSYRIAWARTYLKKSGHLESAGRGLWGVTEKGRVSGPIDARATAASVAARYRSGDQSEEEGIDVDEPQRSPSPTDETLPDTIKRQLTSLATQLVAEGQVPSPEELAVFQTRFRSKFGPDVLRRLEGADLLNKLHERGAANSLVYWLEFKDDDEFPASFGSISGGSALKFGLYQRAESGEWWTGSANAQVKLSATKAIRKARMQRDQLVAGSAVLDEFTASRHRDYDALQARLDEVAPEIADTGWGHKYFALMHPTVLDEFHSERYQAHHLVKLLRLPSTGRYANAAKFADVARSLDLPLSTLTRVLLVRNGPPVGYWRVGTTADGLSEWPRMAAGAFAAIGFGETGELSTYGDTAESRQRLTMLLGTFLKTKISVSTAAGEILSFVAKAKEGDVIVAMDGREVRGIGIVAGPYRYQEGDGPYPHRRPVKWLVSGGGQLPLIEPPCTTFRPMNKLPNQVEIQRRLFGVSTPLTPTAAPRPSVQPLAALTGTVGRIQQALERKRQVILYGPPGTGKTHWAERAILEVIARGWFGKDSTALSAAERAEVEERRAFEMCTFHPSFGYEEFVEGYRPEHEGGLSFRRRDGIFKALCQRASSDPKGRPYVLLIDELNRGDVPRIFGELLTVLEKDKRGKPVTLAVSGERFVVPDNVFVVGTMNTADRSIALLDAALRRRFAFIEMMPDPRALGATILGGIPLAGWLDLLNHRVLQHAGRDARHLQVGHAYLMPGGVVVPDLARFVDILRDDIVPLLEEYCYEDFAALAKILGDRIVRVAERRIDDGLFQVGNHDALCAALLHSFDGLGAAQMSIAAEADNAKLQEEDDEEDELPT